MKYMLKKIPQQSVLNLKEPKSMKVYNENQEFSNEFREAVFRHNYHLNVLHTAVDEEHCPICRCSGKVVMVDVENKKI